jgi:hypothetical protein
MSKIFVNKVLTYFSEKSTAKKKPTEVGFRHYKQVAGYVGVVDLGR